MKLAIMQPYFFPYIGYFQLINEADVFVIYDDVNYIKGGWLNRNYILSQGKPQLLTLETIGASSNKLINQVQVGRNHKKILKTLRQSYAKAPYFDDVFSVIEEILYSPELNLARFLELSLGRICKYLEISCKLTVSSELDKNNNMRGEEKVLEICNLLDATQYINAPGGKALYNYSSFDEKGIKLSFIETRAVQYQQLNSKFVPNLSIIDVMMFNDKENCLNLLMEYEIV